MSLCNSHSIATAQADIFEQVVIHFQQLPVLMFHLHPFLIPLKDFFYKPPKPQQNTIKRLT